jgi:hypothetical protein
MLEAREHQLRLDTHQANLEEVGTYLANQRAKERAEFEAGWAAREKAERQLADTDRYIKNPPRAPLGRAAAEEHLADLDRYLDRVNAAEGAKAVKTISAGESRRLWDYEFRVGYDRSHPGGGAKCRCDAHRLWRKEVV